MIQGSLILKGGVLSTSELATVVKKSRYFTFPMLSLFGCFVWRLQL